MAWSMWSFFIFPIKTNPAIRLVRMGTHQELFQGPLG